MTFESKKIEEIYAGKVARSYDLTTSHFFKRLKKLAFIDSSLKNGDRVLVFCCGTGLDFPHILQRIGGEGSIVGVDFSGAMLSQAAEKIRENSWGNVELIQADVTEFEGRLDKDFDAGVCTLGLSIIRDYKAAYYNLLSYVRGGGEIIIGDLQLAAGWYSWLNPLILFFGDKYGGTREGHQNSRELCSMMAGELAGVRKKELFFGSYFYCIGKTG